MNRIVLQVPVSADLRKTAEMEAKAQGFSSLQEAVRLFLNKLANKAINMTFEEQTVQLSKKAIKRYDKIIDDIEAGKNVYSAKNVSALMRQLHEKS